MKRTVKFLALLLAMLMLLSACSSGTPANTASDSSADTSDNTEFTPKLDTAKAVELNAAVFFGNFEALDQVINHFNEYYPNVAITYSQVGDTSDQQFLADNPYLDIFMTSPERGYPTESCVDLLGAGVDFSAVSDGILNGDTFEGKVLALPMGLTLHGLVVNKTLLEKEGLSVPQTWEEFLTVLETLKQKGYTPIQGPTDAVSQLIYNAGMTMLSRDPALYKAVTEGDAAGAAALEPVYERLFELYDKGYISDEVNADYPTDNYDGAILKFFEGDVPFWVCDTEKVSGMKKRESKSEAFSANPFEYEFIFEPMGDNGVYAFVQPWYGFAVNKDSQNSDYAVEFLRFMARQDELNTLASVKGVPSVARVSDDTRYANLSTIEKVEASTISDGLVPAYFGTLLCHAANDQRTSGSVDAAGAVSLFVEHVTESLQEG